MNIWKHIDERLEAGSDPTINIEYSMLLLPLSKKKGRPKKQNTDEANQYRDLGSLVNQTRPRCMNPECGVRLRNDQIAVCSFDCRIAALGYYRAAVRLLETGVPETIGEENVPEIESVDINARGLPEQLRRRYREIAESGRGEHKGPGIRRRERSRRMPVRSG